MPISQTFVRGIRIPQKGEIMPSGNPTNRRRSTDPAQMGDVARLGTELGSRFDAGVERIVQAIVQQNQPWWRRIMRRNNNTGNGGNNAGGNNAGGNNRPPFNGKRLAGEIILGLFLIGMIILSITGINGWMIAKLGKVCGAIVIITSLTTAFGLAGFVAFLIWGKPWTKVVATVLTVIGVGVFLIALPVGFALNNSSVSEDSAGPSPTVTIEPSATSDPAPSATASPETSETTTPSSQEVEVGTINIDGENVGIDLGNRVYWSSGQQIFGFNPPYDREEMSVIEKTWHDVTVETKEGEVAVLFCYSTKIGDKTYTPGVLVIIAQNGESAELSVLNGEIVIWNDEEAMRADIENRISTEIENGNLSIDAPLAFKYADESFEEWIPQELLDARKVILVDLIS